MKQTYSILILAILAVGALQTAAVAQEGPAPAPVRPFAITSYSGELYVDGDMRRQSEKSGGATTISQQETMLEEGLRLQGQGYIYHPNLFDMFGMINLGEMQEETVVNGLNTPMRGHLRGYNLSGVFLKEKPISLRVFAMSNSSITSREFTTPVTTDRTDYGFEWFTKGRLPMRLLAERLTQHEVSDQRTDDRTTDHLRYNVADRRSNDHITEFTWDREKVAETESFPGGSSLSLPSTKDEFTLNTVQQFGPAQPNRNRFNGQFRWLDRTGFFPEQGRTADLGLELNHTKTLATFYRLFFDKDQTDTTDNRTTTAEAGFRKKIYESLDITGRVAGTDQQFIDGFDKRFGGFLTLDYRKKTGIGLFTSVLNIGREQERESSGTGTRTITDTITLTGVTPVQLSKPNIVAGSIVVTSLDRTITYVEGPTADYELTTLGAFTRVARVLPTTTIPDGGQVLVTYNIEVPKDATWMNEPLNWDNRLRIKNTPFSVFYNFRELEQELIKGLDPGSLNPSRAQLFGADMDYKGFSAEIEHEIVDQLLSPPTRANRGRVGYNRRLDPNTDLSLGASVSRLVYQNPQAFGILPGRDFLNSEALFARLNMRLNQRTTLDIGGEFNKNDGQQKDSLARLTARLMWRYRQLEFSLEAKDSLYTREATTGNEQSVFFKLSRRF
ncbi:MAG: hypothetical protein PHU85_15410 [Phycisphaerae bacterium]|nr:hypothetical protein [Phycisphaerae bacterium]